jgi:3-hydroxyisobutyrate dehydrogenase
MAELEKVGFLGLGIMGSRMAANLVRAGFETTVWNRTRATADDWVAEHGGTAVDTPAEVARASDVIVSIVADGPVVELVMLGEGGVIEGAHDGLLVIDSSTIAPGEARGVAEGLAPHGVAFIDAPVSGSAPKAEDGTLTIMASGAPEDVEQARPLFEAMGATIVNAGAEVGQAQTVKLINNSVAAANAVTLAQALIVGKATGVDLDALVEVMGAGSGNSTMLGLKSRPMRSHDFTTLFKLEHMLKDVRHCLDAARAAGVPFPAAADAGEILSAGVGRGHAEADFAALVEVCEGLAGVLLTDPDLGK